jgi:hypothetical protein
MSVSEQDTFLMSIGNALGGSDSFARPFAARDMAYSKEMMMDFDTVSVSTRATSTNTFSSGSTTTPLTYEHVMHAAESPEAREATRPVKEKRGKRPENPATKAMPFTQAMYKRRFCCHYPDIDQCKRGKKCAFAHSRAEFRGSLLPAEEEHEGEHSDEFYMYRYKTLWCPIGIPHHWKNCVYGHNHLDIRRSPDIGYGPRQCPHWYNCNDKTPYADRCPNGVRCPYTHGAKEQLYHPAYFKTAVCWDVMSDGGCPRSHFCAFHHTKEECRVEETKDMKYDYNQPLGEEEMALLQKDFNVPIPIAADVDGPKQHSKKETPMQPPPPGAGRGVGRESKTGGGPRTAAPADPPAFAGPKVDELALQAAQRGEGSVMFMPALFPYPFVMPSQMMNGATTQTPGGTKVMMMPVMSMPREGPQGVMRPGNMEQILGPVDLAAEFRPNPNAVRDVLDLLK